MGEMMRSSICMMIAAATLTVPASMANALIYDGDVTSNVIFGSGNLNGGFTIARANGVEIGLRGKLRYDQNGLPTNDFNSNGDGSYTFQPGAAEDQPLSTPVWNFEWSVNTDYDGTTGYDLIDLSYQLQSDTDAGIGVTDFAYFDPVLLGFGSSIGDNATMAGEGIEPGSFSYYAYLDSNNLAQNSWSYGALPVSLFFWPDSFDPNKMGEYTISLAAFDDGEELARSTIDVRVGNVSAVPLPASLLMLLTALGGLGALRWRKAVSA